MRLIDGDDLLKRIPITCADEFQNCRYCSLLNDWEVEILVDETPTIDAVEVVRCKDCMYSVDYYNDGDCNCRRPGRVMEWIGKDWNFYCAAGRRKG